MDHVDHVPQVEYFIIGDEAFILQTWLIKPFCRSMGINEWVFNLRERTPLGFWRADFGGVELAVVVIY